MQKISQPKVSLPKGGGAIKGISDNFSPNAFTGTGNFTIPLYYSKGRGFVPNLNISYSTGTGKTSFGIGFSLSLSSIKLQTSKGQPQYLGNDTFLLNGEELVPELQKPKGSKWQHIPAITMLYEGNSYKVSSFRERNESAFSKIEYWDSDENPSFWKVTERNNITHIFGNSTNTQVFNPNSQSSKPNKYLQVFEWLIEESYDDKGNHISFEYNTDQNDPTQKYISKIKYGNEKPYLPNPKKPTPKSNKWYFQQVFDYGAVDFNDPQIKDYNKTNEIVEREDPFSAYNSGFRIRNNRLCRAILMYHQFDTTTPVLVHGTYFDYQENKNISQLRGVKAVGYKTVTVKSKTTTFQKSTPPLSFSYSSRNPAYLGTLPDVISKDLLSNKVSALLSVKFSEVGISIPEKTNIDQLPNNSGQQITLNNTTYTVKKVENRINVYDESKINDFRELKNEMQQPLTGTSAATGHQFVDLYGEGLEGILYSDQSTVSYQKSLGEGQYEILLMPNQFPVNKDLRNGINSLQSLNGNGQMDLVVDKSSFQGFYQQAEEEKWESFEAFLDMPVEFNNPEKVVVDVTGNGIPDVIFFEQENIKVYPSKGTKGFGNAIITNRKNGLPQLTQNSNNEVIAFADMFGDGRSHLVRIANGNVECWPNLGYGKFGDKVVFENAPAFHEGLNANRLKLADIDGSGTSDIIYTYENHLEVFYNLSGNGFSKPEIVMLPMPVNELSSIQFTDVLGNGTNALVVSSLKQGLQTNHQYYDFCGQKKPYLLTHVNNHSGATTKFTYQPSTKFYLADKKAGRSWVTKLPFPVQLLQKIESTDHIANTNLAKLFAYHDGFYDPVEKEFRGFGFVERWDTETFDDYNKKPKSKSSVPEDNYVPPVYTKSWYNTGVYDAYEKLLNTYKKEFFKGDKKAYAFPDSQFDLKGFDTNGEDLRQAYVALHGQLIREEVYGLNSKEPELFEIPYSVAQSNVLVKLVQPKLDNKYAVYFAATQESIQYEYYHEKGNPDFYDPLISHQFNLKYDDYGNLTKSCHVSYPRRQNLKPTINGTPTTITPYPEQLNLKISGQTNTFFNITDTGWYLGILQESQTFEVGWKKYSGVISFDTLKTQFDNVIQNISPYDKELTPNTYGARQLSWNLHYYWNGSNTPELGSASLPLLLHHSEEAAFSVNHIDDVFKGKVQQGVATINPKSNLVYLPDLGYKSYPKGDQKIYWWALGLVQYYNDKSEFYLPKYTEDVFKNKTSVSYDNYKLFVKDITDAKSFVTKIQYDYNQVTPIRITDPNDNISEVLLDPFGKVIATSDSGEENGKQKGNTALYELNAKNELELNYDLSVINSLTTKSKGNTYLEAVIDNPKTYVQGAAGFFYYNLDAWYKQNQPPSFISLNPKIFASEKPTQNIYSISLGYSDGFGRNLESKILRDQQTKTSAGKTTTVNTWEVSGRTVYNNKGEPVIKYKPFFSNTYQYQSDEKATQQGGIWESWFYDPLLRVIRVDYPEGVFTKTDYKLWSTIHYDKNDTFKDSPFYNNLSQKEKDEYKDFNKINYDTPNTLHHNNMGQTFLKNEILIELKETKVKGKGSVKTFPKSILNTLFTLNFKGQQLKSSDPRLYSAKKRGYNFEYTYSISGVLLKTISADEGTSFKLLRSTGQIAYSWGSRGFKSSIAFDALNRPVTIAIDGQYENGTKLNAIVEKFFYGDSSMTKTNRANKLIAHYDQAGVTFFNEYSFRGALLSSQNQLISDYKNGPDWVNIKAPTLPKASSTIFNNEVYLTNQQFYNWGSLEEKTEQVSQWDASGNLQPYSPFEKVTHQPDYSIGMQLKDVNLLKNGKTNQYVSDITYNAIGQRVSLNYNNGAKTTFSYDKLTERLTNILSTANSGKKQLQDISYTYDPVGNVTRVVDNSIDIIFNSGQKVQPSFNYQYDSLYRLTQGTGRMLPGLYGSNNDIPDYAKSITPIPNPADASKIKNYTRNYSYDTGGNLIEINQVNGFTKKINIADDSNRGLPSTSTSTIAKAYDAHGNLKEIQTVADVNWDYRNRIENAVIVKRTGANNDAEYYVYNSAGQRVRKVKETWKNKATTCQYDEKIYQGGYEIKRTYNGNVMDKNSLSSELITINISDGNSKIVLDKTKREGINTKKETTTNKAYYQLGNRLNSVNMQLNDKAEVITYEEYFPFGGTALSAGKTLSEVSAKEYRYSGKERDNSTGLYYYGARYYISWLGRWMSPDPAGTIDGLNLYAFVTNNPVTFVDVGGMMRASSFLSKEDRAKEEQEKGERNQRIVAARKNAARPKARGQAAAVNRKTQPDIFQLGAAVTSRVEAALDDLHGLIASIPVNIQENIPSVAGENRDITLERYARGFKQVLPQEKYNEFVARGKKLLSKGPEATVPPVGYHTEVGSEVLPGVVSVKTNYREVLNSSSSKNPYENSFDRSSGAFNSDYNFRNHDSGNGGRGIPNSEVIHLQFQEATRGGGQKITRINRNTIINTDTVQLINQTLGEQKHAFLRPGTDDFFAFLGSENGRSAAYLLSQHPEDIDGNRIDRIVVAPHTFTIHFA